MKRFFRKRRTLSLDVELILKDTAFILELEYLARHLFIDLHHLAQNLFVLHTHVLSVVLAQLLDFSRKGALIASDDENAQLKNMVTLAQLLQ